MDKYGVETVSPEKTAEAAPAKCPNCGALINTDSGVTICPDCGTKPFEAP